MGLKPAVVCVWPLGCVLGEGPVWWQNALWFTDIKQKMLHRYCPGSGDKRSWPAPSEVGFLAPLNNDHFIAGTRNGLYEFDPSSGGFILIRTVEPERPGNRLNDGAVDIRDRLWFGSMDDGEKAPTGSLYRFDRDGLALMDGGYIVTNGPAFSPDGRVLYHADSLGRIIYAFDLGDDGSLANKRVFAVIEEEAGFPDGLAVDSEACVWAGLFGGWAVRRYSPQGALLESVAFPVANVTKIAFGGAGLTTAYATTARIGVSGAGQPLAGGLFSFEAAVSGQPQFCAEAGTN